MSKTSAKHYHSEQLTAAVTDYNKGTDGLFEYVFFTLYTSREGLSSLHNGISFDYDIRTLASSSPRSEDVLLIYMYIILRSCRMKNYQSKKCLFAYPTA